ncbi:MAG: histidine kinase, partial [Bacteroidetes bacterium]|nr:histidine kinase [Bacteroidota bacterium]
MEKTVLPQVDFQYLVEFLPDFYVILLPNSYEIVAASNGYLAATTTKRESILGFTLFDVLPESLKMRTSDLKDSFDIVMKTKAADTMAVRKYDKEKGAFIQGYWKALNTPILNENGEIAFIMHSIEDVR